MKNFASTLIVLGASVFLFSCGSGDSSGTDGNKSYQKGPVKLILEVFAGYSCSSCNEELPVLNQKLIEELGPEGAGLDARVYVVAGPNWTKATQDVANRYGQELGLTRFTMHVDNRCQTEYRKFYPGTSCLVPAAVLLSPSGEAIDVYDPGILDLDQFVARVRELLNG